MQKESLIRSLAGTQSPDYLVVDRQSTNDIINQLTLKHRECMSHYDRIYKYFEGGTLEDICYRLWKFCKNNFTYVIEDEEEQWTSCPYTMLTNGKVDCKNYALFIAGVLDAMKRHGQKLTWEFRFASYELFKPVGHVFVVVDANDPDYGIWIDPVLDYFNWHLFYFHGRSKKLRTGAAIAGIGRIGAARVGSAEGDLLSKLLQYQQGLLQAIQLSNTTSTFNAITQKVLQGVSIAIPGIAAALAVLKLAQAPINNAFGPGSSAALIYSDITSLNIGGLVSNIFNGRTYNTDQYWGAAFYYFYVKGQDITNQDEVTDAMVLPALQWFIDRTGVFISGRQHIMALIAGVSDYLALAKANTDTTTNTPMVAAAVKVAQTYWHIAGTPNRDYATFTESLKGSWANTVGVFDTGLAALANQYGETAETYAAQTGDQYATNLNAGLPAIAPAGTTNSLIPGVDNMWLYLVFGGIIAIGLIKN